MMINYVEYRRKRKRRQKISKLLARDTIERRGAAQVYIHYIHRRCMETVLVVKERRKQEGKYDENEEPSGVVGEEEEEEAVVG